MKTATLFQIIFPILIILYALREGIEKYYETHPTEKRSKTYHFLGGLFLAIMLGFSYYLIFGLSFTGLRPLATVLVLWMILFDISYNIGNKQDITYAGNGKGAMIESLVFWISQKIKIFSFPETMWILKFTITLIIILIFNL
jgi:hypothetical protein